MLSWSKSSSGSPVLAVGTVKGNLQLYNIRERRRTPIVGKHTKRVCCGVWSSSVLAMAALDKTVRAEDKQQLQHSHVGHVTYAGQQQQAAAIAYKFLQAVCVIQLCRAA
jgi:WD40 repeat protein